MIMGIDVSTGTFVTMTVIEIIIGFLIGFFILPKALKWAIISIIVIGILAYFGFVTIKLDAIKDAFKGSGIKSLLLLISLPLVIGLIIGFVVRKVYD